VWHKGQNKNESLPAILKKRRIFNWWFKIKQKKIGG
jgi:hypothetical protein